MSLNDGAFVCVCLCVCVCVGAGMTCGTVFDFPDAVCKVLPFFPVVAATATATAVAAVVAVFPDIDFDIAVDTDIDSDIDVDGLSPILIRDAPAKVSNIMHQILI
jgi:hypothetical protein